MRRLFVLALAALLAVPLALPAAAQSEGELRDDLEDVTAEIDRIEERIEAARTEQSSVARTISSTRDTLTSLVANLEAAEAALADVQAEHRTRTADLAQVRRELDAQYARLEVTRRDLVETRDEAIVFAREAYMSAGHGLTDLAFSADAFTDVAVGTVYLARANEITELGMARLEALEVQEDRQRQLIEQEEAAVGLEVAALADLEAEQDALREQIDDRRQAVAAELTSQQSLLSSLEREEELFAKELDALAEEQERIERLIAEKQSQGGEAPGVLVRPVPGRVSSGFGYRIHPIYGTSRLHTGLDMSAGYGEPIKAAAAGTVILAAWYGGYGNAVVLDHGGGMATLYAHQSSLAVSSGSTVATGDVIGYVGSTGLSTGPHLHFEVRMNGTPVDPLPYL